ncbi:N-acyl homoserine lactonase family protein [Microbacterium sp. NPDC019599]|uniref:N-acyl homoserine lactonase family protein n=1 Tax=Microbacterium sp. NPDC019599 TaxID=3154690 RepID=UPI003405F6EB
MSTGSVRIRPEHARRTWKPLALWLLTSRRWTSELPINVFVIEHADGLVLFDAGQDRRGVVDPEYFPAGLNGWFYRRLAMLQVGRHETLPALLVAAGYDPDRVTQVVFSHLHFDHIGGIRDFPNAEFVVSAVEWRQLRRPGAVLRGYLKRHIDLPGARWRLVDFDTARGGPVGEFTSTEDLFGDGSLRLLPTPGHTPGSLSLLLSRPGLDPILLVGDLTYDARRFDRDHVPGVGDRAQLQSMTDRVNRLRKDLPGLVIAAAHDPEAAARFEGAIGSKPD